MNKNRRPIFLIILVAYIFAPALHSWVFDPNGAWFRPFIIWMFVVIITFAVQITRPADAE